MNGIRQVDFGYMLCTTRGDHDADLSQCMDLNSFHDSASCCGFTDLVYDALILFFPVTVLRGGSSATWFLGFPGLWHSAVRRWNAAEVQMRP